MNKKIIFTDGSSRGNPGPGGWGSVIVDEDNIIELGGREDNTTNNRMEITACIRALEGLNSMKDNITIYTDSSYVINGITKWILNWKKNNWITKTKEDVINRDLWERLDMLVQDKHISWQYIGGHSGVVGNERCDEIATGFADEKDIDLYNGNIYGYPIKNILDLSSDMVAVKSKVNKKSHSKVKAYSYVSMVDGKIETHATWPECEARVKGKSSAKYKKAISSEDEERIIEEFSLLNVG